MGLIQAVCLLMSLTLAVGQRGSFAGTRPIGFPEQVNRTTTTSEGLGDRFGEDNANTTTPKLPLEALGDRDLVDRLNKLPADSKPFWLLNAQALEDNRNNPQSYPQKPSGFAVSLEDLAWNGQSSQSQNVNSGITGQPPLQSTNLNSQITSPRPSQNAGLGSAGNSISGFVGQGALQNVNPGLNQNTVTPTFTNASPASRVPPFTNSGFTRLPDSGLSSRFSGNSQGSGNPRFPENSAVTGNVRFPGNSVVTGNSRFPGNSGVSGSLRFPGNTGVTGNSKFPGNSGINGNSRFPANAAVAGNPRFPVGQRNNAV